MVERSSTSIRHLPLLRSRRRAFPPLPPVLALAGLLLLLAAGSAQAHPHIFFDIDLHLHFGVGEEVRADFTLYPNETTCAAMILEGDLDGNFLIEENEIPELTAIWRAYFKKFRYFVRFRNGKDPCELSAVEDFRIRTFPGDKSRLIIAYTACASLPDRDLGSHALEVDLTDQTIYAAFTQLPDKCVIHTSPARIEIEKAAVLKHHRGVHVDYTIKPPPEETAPESAGGETGDGDAESATTLTVETAAVEEGRDLKARFYELLKKGQDKLTALLKSLSRRFKLGLFLTLIGVALGYGVVHALGPGHGKALVAAFLMRGNSRPLHAVGLSLVVTATHTGTAILLAAGVQLMKSSMQGREFQEAGQAWIGLGSGVLVAGIGLFPVLFLAFRVLREARRQGSLHEGFRAAVSENASAGAVTEEEITIARVGRWGVAAGLVPCPASIVIMLFAIAAGVFWIGLVAVMALALGLSFVLLIIGLSVVYSRKGLLKRLEGSRWASRLQGALGVGGVLLVIGLGLLLISFYWYRLDMIGAV